MPRKTHQKGEEEIKEWVRYDLRVSLPREMHRFLEVESKRLSKKQERRVTPGMIVRAVLSAYYEKRMAGLLVDPDD